MKLSSLNPKNFNPLVWIVCFGAIVRLLWLDTCPAELNVDEYAKAYNAFSLIETGKTFRGLSWPLYFTDFDSTQPSIAIVYNYLVIPSVYLFGLNMWAVRLPAAFLGIVTIPLVYYLAEALFRNRSVSIVSATLLAFSPWHVYMSRWAIEPVSLPVFFLTGFLLCLKSRDRPGYAILAGGCLGTCFYCYPAAALVVPGFLALFFFTYVRDNRQSQVNFALTGFLVCVALLPVIFLWGSGVEILGRAKTTSVFSYLGLFEASTYFGLQLLAVPVSLLALFVPQIIILLWQQVCSCRAREVAPDSVHERFLLLLLAVGVIPACVTISSTQFYAAFLRAISIVGIVEMLVAACIVRKHPVLLRPTSASILLWISWIVASVALYGGYVAICDATFGRRDYGFGEAYRYLDQRASEYQKVMVDLPQPQPFISFLYHSRYSPSKFLSHSVVRKKEYWSLTETVEQFDKYFFCDQKGCPPVTGRTLIMTIPGRYQELTEVHRIVKNGVPTVVFREHH